jgi:hypothetical protein
MKKLLILPLVLLSGCAVHVEPVTARFPDAPNILKEPCPELDTLAQDAQLSDLMIVITMNYMKSHECRRKVEGWNEWHTKQKAIFEEATK